MKTLDEVFEDKVSVFKQKGWTAMTQESVKLSKEHVSILKHFAELVMACSDKTNVDVDNKTFIKVMADAGTMMMLAWVLLDANEEYKNQFSTNQ